ncbi:MAG TPA: hypothetical protein PKV21_01055 [bacterium]|nr:hypothetical protein [bacterium]HOM26076.1 hypothetical protein [bacterium]
MKKIIEFACVLLILTCFSLKAERDYKLDWYNWVEVKTAPYMLKIDNLTDSDTKTVSEYLGGPEIGGWIEWQFPSPVNVSYVKFMQSGADTFSLMCDTDGKLLFNIEVGKVKVEKPDEWIIIPVNKKVFGLKLIALSGKAGYRTPYPTFKEIEIYTKEKITPEKKREEKSKAILNKGNKIQFPELNKKNIKFIPCIDLWMAGIIPGDKMQESTEEIEKSNGFQTMLKKLREIDAQGVRIFLETYCCNNKMPWKSQLAPNYGKDTLKGFIDALHKNNLTSAIFLHAWISPIQPAEKMLPMPDRRWDYPYEQSDLVASKGLYEGYEPNRYPCVICDDDFKTKWFGLLKEVVERGIDEVYVMPDEYYFKGHNLETVRCPSCEREFKKRYGYESLPKVGKGGGIKRDFGPDPRKMIDNEHYRKWKLFEYEKIAELFNEVADKLKKLNPNLNLISSANPASSLYSNLGLEHGIAFDIIGRGKSFTHIQLYAHVPLNYGGYTALARRMSAAYPDANLSASIQSLGFKHLKADKSNEILFYGYLIPFIMNGATRIDLYRLNYVEGNGWWERIKNGIKMVRLLEEWGITESKSVAETCLLISRASEDWWQVKAQSAMGTVEPESKRSTILYMEEKLGTVQTETTDEMERTLNFERFRGMYSNRAIESVLIENGIQYDVKYTEREETLGDLSKYKLLILPFSYSMSKKAYENIKKAVESGTKLVIFNQLAPTNEYGEPYSEPLLKELLNNPNVKFIDINPASEGMKRSFKKFYGDLFYKLLGTKYYFNNNDNKVEYVLRKIDNKNFILYLANWDKNESTCVIGIPVASGNYRILIYSSLTDELREGTMKGTFGNKNIIKGYSFKNFGIKISPGEVLLVKIYPEK